MGIDYNANLGYGFLLTEEVAYNMNEGTLDTNRKVFDVAWAGDAYGDAMQTFFFIKESAYDTFAHFEHKSPLKKNALVVQPDWDSLLLEEAKRLGITKPPKIGWWLLCSVS